MTLERPPWKLWRIAIQSHPCSNRFPINEDCCDKLDTARRRKGKGSASFLHRPRHCTECSLHGRKVHARKQDPGHSWRGPRSYKLSFLPTISPKPPQSWARSYSGLQQWVSFPLASWLSGLKEREYVSSNLVCSYWFLRRFNC